MTWADSRIAKNFQKQLLFCTLKIMASNYIKSLPLGSSVARTRGSVIVANDLTGKSSHKFDSDYLEDATVVGRQALFGGTITNAVVVVVERRVARFLNRL